MRILIANPFGIGDVLFSLPLVRAIRAADPGGTLGYLSNRRTAEIVSSWKELGWKGIFEKDELRAARRRSKKEGWGILSGMIDEIRRQRFDTLVDLSLGWHYGLAGLLAGIPRRVGFNFRNRGKFLTHSLRTGGFHAQPVAEYYLDLLPLLGLPRTAGTHVRMELPASAESGAEEFLRGQGIDSRSLLGLVPGGGASWGPNAVFKQWAPERFAETADALTRQAAFSAVLIFGDLSESALCERVAAAMRWPGRKAPVQVSSLLTLAGLLRRCALVIGNDSGPLHLAEMVDAPTVSIFGPVDPSVYGPFSSPLHHHVVTRGLVCQPCYQGFRFPPCPWDNRCLKQLEPALVLQQAESLLKKAPDARSC